MTRLTTAQALVRFLAAQELERDGERARFFAGCLGIFGHGNVVRDGPGAAPAPGPAALRPRAQRAGHGPRRLRLRAPAQPARDLGVHVVGRPGRDEHGHRRRARDGQPPARAAAPRRHVRQPPPAPGAAGARGTARRQPLGQRLLPAGLALLRAYRSARATARRRAAGDARAHRPGRDRRGDARAARGRHDRGVRGAGRVPRAARVDDLPAPAGARGARAAPPR